MLKRALACLGRLRGEWALASISLAKDVGFEFFVLNASAIVLVDDLEEGVDVLALDRDLKLGDQVGHLVDGQEAALIQIKVAEDFLKQRRVLARKLEHSRLHLPQ